MAPNQAQHRIPRFLVSHPQTHVIQVTLNRPEKFNCIDTTTSREISKVWELLDNDENLRVGIITATGKAFCVGADLQEWNELNKTGVVNDMSPPGLAGLPRRAGKKPVIAAVNGITMGGGFEMIANCDMVIAASTAIFALPEVKRGIVPVAGCLPRLIRTLGLQRTMDLVLTGRSVSAQTLHEWGLVNRVLQSSDNVIDVALQVARDISNNSPDAIIVGRLGVRLAWENGSVESAVTDLVENWYPRLLEGANFGEGIQAFVEKRQPKWTKSRL